MAPAIIHNSYTASNGPTNNQHPPGDREPDDGPGGPNDDPLDDGNNDGPVDPFDPSKDSDHPDEENVHHNLADVIAALARNVQHQRDGSHLKFREPDPLDGTNTTKLRTFLVQLQLNFNDRPRAFSEDQRKVNFTISYLKGIALAHFENTLIEPDIFHPAAWDDNYKEFISELKMDFRAPDIIREAESKLENLVIKPNQRITKYLVEFNQLPSITGWDNHVL